jgi:hypothetical protein
MGDDSETIHKSRNKTLKSHIRGFWILMTDQKQHGLLDPTE